MPFCPLILAYEELLRVTEFIVAVAVAGGQDLCIRMCLLWHRPWARLPVGVVI